MAKPKAGHSFPPLVALVCSAGGLEALRGFAAARTGTALEINAFPDRLDLNDELARRARSHGVRFAVNTDAHAVPHLDHIRFGIATAQRAWLEAGDVINTYPPSKLRRFLAKRPTSTPSMRSTMSVP